MTSQREKLRLSLKPRSTIALLFLSFFMQETHELAHTGVGRIICGCWGRRNFNLWGLCSGCSDEKPLSILATWGGPAYTFSLIWLGVLLLTKPSPRQKSFGFALVVSSMPFSRIVSPLTGSGDEVFALRTHLGNHTAAWAIGLAAVLLLVIPPVVRLFRTIGNRRRGWWLVGLLLVPFLMTGLVVFAILQSVLLENGVLASYGILGSPILVTVWFAICVVVVVIFGNSLGSLLQPMTSGSRPTE